jgi:hypothetical protein
MAATMNKTSKNRNQKRLQVTREEVTQLTPEMLAAAGGGTRCRQPTSQDCECGSGNTSITNR